MPHTANERQVNYRADLDGLRAVAIVCVVMFHAYPQFLSGGLMGVDLFFVLSGYLITNLLLRRQMLSTADIWRFYRHRLQRLYPPLLLFLITILLLGWSVFDTLHYNALWQYALNASFFTTNLYLAVDQGVLSDSYAHNPFLHLWSLAIEAQFYVLWPWVVLYGVTTQRWKVSLSILAILSVVSACFLANIGAEKWLFYAPSSRLFEMIAGAAVACYGRTLLKPLSPYISVISVLVLLCFALGLMLIDPYQPYPNLTTLFPVAAATLFILNDPQSRLNQLLATAPLVYIGRISYSWYLWHWGLLALYQQTLPMWLLILISFVLAALSYRWLELPLQRLRRQP